MGIVLDGLAALVIAGFALAIVLAFDSLVDRYDPEDPEDLR